MGGNVQDLQTVSGPEVELILASVTQPSILGPLGVGRLVRELRHAFLIAGVGRHPTVCIWII